MNAGAIRLVCAVLAIAAAPARVNALQSGPVGQTRTYFAYGLAGTYIDSPERHVIDLHGLGHSDHPERPYRRCYQLKPKSTFLTVIFYANNPSRTVAGVLVTVEPSCPASAQSAAEVRDVELVGCGQIRLGDPAEKLRDLGAELRTPGARWWPNAPAEVSQYDYRCEPEQQRRVKASAFVRAGRVIGVSMWVPDEPYGA